MRRSCRSVASSAAIQHRRWTDSGKQWVRIDLAGLANGPYEDAT
jgi:hypothetical protein